MDEYYGMWIISQFFLKLMKSNFLLGPIFKNSQGGKPRGMLGLIAPSVSESPLAREKRCPRLLPSPTLTGAPLSALASLGPISARPTFLFSTRIPARPPGPILMQSHTPSLLHFPHWTYYHLFFISLQNSVLFITLSHLHKNSPPANSWCSINFWWMNKLGRKVYTEICTGYYLKDEAPCFKMCFSPIKKDFLLHLNMYLIFKKSCTNGILLQSNLQIFIHFKENRHHKHKNFSMQNSNLQQENKHRNLFLDYVVITALSLKFLIQSPKK